MSPLSSVPVKSDLSIQTSEPPDDDQYKEPRTPRAQDGKIAQVVKQITSPAPETPTPRTLPAGDDLLALKIKKGPAREKEKAQHCALLCYVGVNVQDPMYNDASTTLYRVEQLLSSQSDYDETSFDIVEAFLICMICNDLNNDCYIESFLLMIEHHDKWHVNLYLNTCLNYFDKELIMHLGSKVTARYLERPNMDIADKEREKNRTFVIPICLKMIEHKFFCPGLYFAAAFFDHLEMLKAYLKSSIKYHPVNQANVTPLVLVSPNILETLLQEHIITPEDIEKAKIKAVIYERLKKEYYSLPASNYPISIEKATAEEHKMFTVAFEKIRKGIIKFTPFLPLNHSLVKINQDPNSYYDASYIGDKYIAAQAPSKRSVNTFWRMVQEEEVDMIVMLCDFDPRFCTNYLAEGDYGDIYVKSNIQNKHLFDETLYITQRKVLLNDKKDLIHLHFHTWPDGSITNPIQVVHLMQLVLGAKVKGKILVHCFAGKGRTGTLISQLLVAEQNISDDQERAVMTHETNHMVRSARNGAIQTSQQHRFITQVLDLFHIPQIKFVT